MLHLQQKSALSEADRKFYARYFGVKGSDDTA